MGYTIKIQKVKRPTNQSFYVTLPSALAEAMNIKKGESFLILLSFFYKKNKKLPIFITSVEGELSFLILTFL